MTDGKCFGCGADAPGVISCDDCWKRVPTNLPDMPRWRTRLRNSRGRNAWGDVERIVIAVRAWLTAHPKRAL